MRFVAVAFVVALLGAAALALPQSTLAAPGPTAIALTGGGDHTCIVTDGTAKCWGENEFGQLGDGTTFERDVPTNVTGLSGIARISAGLSHTCAITNAGALYCWGKNTRGQLGDGTTSERHVPTAVPGLGSGVTDVATGFAHTCAVVAGGVKCWGDNIFGQLGDNTTNQHLPPTEVPGLTGIVAVTAGGYFTCALTSGGGAKCWGDNTYGKVGDSSTDEQHAPVDVTGLASGVDYLVASEGGHTCALMDTGALKCWGNNEYGQLGEDRACPTPCTAPVDVTGLTSGVTAVSVGDQFTCAVVSGGGVKCFGNNVFGQLGDNQVCGDLCDTPVDVSGLSGATSIVLGSRHACAMAASGLYCWGDNFSGQLGDNRDCGHYCLTPVLITLESFATGDANCDHATNSIDSALVLQYGAGLIASLACQAQADTNGDSSVNSIDAALILQYDAGLITSFPA